MIRRFLPVFVLLAACQGNEISKDNEPNLRALSEAEVQISSSTNDFAFNLLKNTQKEKPENTFLSPLSVSMALAMTLNGTDGETRQSILNTINYGDFTAGEVNRAYKDLLSLLTTTDEQVELAIANSVWYNNNFHVKNEFSKTITESYDGIVQGLNFKNAEESKAIINEWVEKKTHDRIKDLIDEITDDDAMFLVNAIYFKGEWTHKFDKSRTYFAPFFTPEADIRSPLMYVEGATVNRYSNNLLTLVDIPYGNEQFSLVVIMPRNPKNLGDLVGDLNADDFSDWLSQTEKATLTLELPQFKMEWKKDLKSNLKVMGMHMQGFPHLFEEEPNIEITGVMHKSFLEVNEDGSEAAAATSVNAQVVSGGGPPKITLNKSFVFLIRERHTGTILFIGQLVDPAKL